MSEKYDLVLLDCSPGFDVETLAALYVAGGLLLITNPDYPSLVSTAKAVEYAKLAKIPVGGVVLTKIMNKKYELKGEEIEKALKVKILERIPFDKKIPLSIANKIPLVLFKPRSKASRAYRSLAAIIVGEKNHSSLLKRFIKRKN